VNALDDWLQRLQPAPLPVDPFVLGGLRAELEREDSNLNAIGERVAADLPLSVNVFMAACEMQRHRERDPPDSVADAYRLLGTTRMLALVASSPREEVALPDTRQEFGFHHTLARATLAGMLAQAWARLRLDRNTDAFLIGAWLHELLELFLWRDAPETIQAVYDRVASGERFTDAFASVLGFSLREGKLALSRRLGLPELITESLDPNLRAHPQARPLGLAHAVRLARACESGLHHPEVPELLPQIADYIGTTPATVQALIQHTLVAGAEAQWVILRTLIQQLHEALDLHRVVIGIPDPARTTLTHRFVMGEPKGGPLHGLQIGLTEKSLFSVLLRRPQGLWINRQNQAKFWPLLPPELKPHLDADRGLMLMSLVVSARPIGVLFADRGTGEALDSQTFHFFVELCQITMRGLEPQRRGAADADFTSSASLAESAANGETPP